MKWTGVVDKQKQNKKKKKKSYDTKQQKNQTSNKINKRVT